MRMFEGFCETISLMEAPRSRGICCLITAREIVQLQDPQGADHVMHEVLVKGDYSASEQNIITRDHAPP